MMPPTPRPSPFDTDYHAPVLVAEVLALFGNAKSVLDCTLGGGGHAHALLTNGVPFVAGVDRDPAALEEARSRLAGFAAAGRFEAVEGNYADFAASAAADSSGDAPAASRRRFDGILLDLGISSRQVDAAERGFTFRPGAPLDMRMETAGLTAAGLLNSATEGELKSIFKEYGDEPRAGRLAREVLRRRATTAFESSDDLVKAIRGALGPRTGPADFARLFQALRIAVNDELTGLERALPALRERLNPGGTIAVITYHSGEDRIVKNFFRDWSAECVCPPRQPVCSCRGRALGKTLTRRPIKPAEREVARNPRARSAKLRAWRAA